MSVRQAEPLPECQNPDCGRPTRRAVWQTTGGYCTACSAWQHAVADVGEDQAMTELEQLRDWQRTVRDIRRAEAVQRAERAQRRRAKARQQGRR